MASIDAQVYARLFKVLGSQDIHALVRTFSEISGGPVFLADPGLNLISLHPGQPIGEKIFDELHRQRKLSDELTVECQKFYLSGTSDIYDPFYVDTDPDGNYNPRVMAEVHQDAKVFGHLVLYLRGRTFRQEDLALVRLFADAALIKLRQGTSSSYSARAALEALLGAEIPKESSMLMRSIEEKLGSSTVMLVAAIPGRTQDRSFAHFVLDTINEQYRDAVACRPGQHLVILKRFSSQDVERRTLVESLRKLRVLLGKFDLTLACTDPIVGLEHLRDHYEVAKLTIKGLRHEQDHIPRPHDESSLSRVVFCADSLPGQLFHQVALSGKASLYVPQVLKRMHCEHAADGTLFESLRQYYLNFGNIDAAARILCVHRNTLIYRLHRIRELYGVDYKDPAIMRRMYVAFELIESSGGKDGLWMG